MTELMPALVVQGPGRMEVEEVPVPDLGPGDVLVAVDHCGVCGSDLHMVLEGWGPRGMTPGHEWTGVVSAVGPSVTRWAPGDAVVGGPGTTCGTCRHCRTGRPSLCSGRAAPLAGEMERGAFARFKKMPEDGLLARPDGVPSRVAALAEPLAVALHGIGQGRIEPGMRVLVFGAGPIGALSIAALRALGVDDVACVEPAPLRQALARDVGATSVIAPDALDQPPMWEPTRIVDGAADVVLECSGKKAAMEAGLSQLERGGTLVFVGAGIEGPTFDPNRILLNELVITGAYEYAAGGFEQSLAMLASGRLPVDRLIEPDDVPLTGCLDAMQRLASGELAGKVMITP